MYKRYGKIYFGLLKTQVRFLINENLKDLEGLVFSTCALSTLYTAFPHNLIKENVSKFIEQIFNREGAPYFDFYEKHAFPILNNLKDYKLWSFTKVCDDL